MNVHVFTGPTLSAAEASTVLDAAYCPPATQGSVFQAACQRPRVIAIIDGRFESVPSVWHKEILWAMDQGIHVFGSASMGALRAAELSAFGMVGVGKVFAAYAAGELEDDDEVAVAHAGGAQGYAASSDAMVNIRATLAAAASAQVISAESKETLETLSKEMFYADRSYGALLERSAGRIPDREHQAFADWLPQGKIDQKLDDAIAMLRTIAEFLETDPGPKQVRFTFQNTSPWERVLRTQGERAQGESANESSVPPVIEELRLSGDLYRRTKGMAMSRFLAVRESLREGMEPAPESVAAAAADFRRVRGLEQEQAFQQWLAANSLNLDEYARLMEDQVRVRWSEAICENGIWTQLLDQLRVDGTYQQLARRAASKWESLGRRGLLNPTLADAAISESELMQWFFQDCVGTALPPDLSRAALDLGFEDFPQFQRAVLREYCFRKFGR
jgi:hypothetical protein